MAFYMDPIMNHLIASKMNGMDDSSKYLVYYGEVISDLKQDIKNINRYEVMDEAMQKVKKMRECAESITYRKAELKGGILIALIGSVFASLFGAVFARLMVELPPLKANIDTIGLIAAAILTAAYCGSSVFICHQGVNIALKNKEKLIGATKKHDILAKELSDRDISLNSCYSEYQKIRKKVKCIFSKYRYKFHYRNFFHVKSWMEKVAVSYETVIKIVATKKMLMDASNLLSEPQLNNKIFRTYMEIV